MMGWGAGYALQILYGLTFANGDQLQVAEKHKVDNTGLVSKHKYSRFRFFFVAAIYQRLPPVLTWHWR